MPDGYSLSKRCSQASGDASNHRRHSRIYGHFARDRSARRAFMRAQSVKDRGAVLDDPVGVCQGLQVRSTRDGGADEFGQRLDGVDFGCRPFALAAAVRESRSRPASGHRRTPARPTPISRRRVRKTSSFLPSKSRTWPATVSPRSSRGIQRTFSPTFDQRLLGVLEFRRGRQDQARSTRNAGGFCPGAACRSIRKICARSTPVDFAIHSITFGSDTAHPDGRSSSWAAVATASSSCRGEAFREPPARRLPARKSSGRHARLRPVLCDGDRRDTARSHRAVLSGIFINIARRLSDSR